MPAADGKKGRERRQMEIRSWSMAKQSDKSEREEQDGGEGGVGGFEGMMRDNGEAAGRVEGEGMLYD